MKSTFFITALGMIALPAVNAQWCQYFYDSACTNNANGGTSFDCANNSVFGSGGGFVKCHPTASSSQSAVTITRCNDSNCNSVINSVNVYPDQTCQSTGGAGPWYKESCYSSIDHNGP